MYQPIADVRSRQIVHVEALCRWNHPVHGFIPPDEFIGIAEQMGLITQITDFVLSEACAPAGGLARDGLTIGLAVNVSGREFADVSLVERVAASPPGERHPGPAPHARSDRDRGHGRPRPGEQGARRARRSGHQLGDRRLRHRLLLAGVPAPAAGAGAEDRPLVRDQPAQRVEQPRSSSAPPSPWRTRSGSSVVAEGAEDEVTCAMLADADCDFIQGYYLSKPITSTQLESKLLEGVPLKGTNSRSHKRGRNVPPSASSCRRPAANPTPWPAPLTGSEASGMTGPARCKTSVTNSSQGKPDSLGVPQRGQRELERCGRTIF